MSGLTTSSSSWADRAAAGCRDEYGELVAAVRDALIMLGDEEIASTDISHLDDLGARLRRTAAVKQTALSDALAATTAATRRAHDLRHQCSQLAGENERRAMQQRLSDRTITPTT